MKRTNSPRPSAERGLEELPVPTTTDTGENVTAFDRRAAVSNIAAPEVLNLDIRDLARRKALSTKDAVEAEIGLIRSVRVLGVKLRRMSKAYLEGGEDAPNIRDISAIALTIQRAANAHSQLSTANSGALNELRAIAESLASRTDEETVKEALRHYLLVKRRKSKSPREIKRRAAQFNGDCD